MRELNTIQKREKLNTIYAMDKKGNGPITDEGFVGINSKKESVTLFSAKAYVLYIGFSVEIGFNFSGFFKDLAEIF